ncbi:carboxypeptidase M32 [Aneurinibacillus thermoaerophilus]|uniref:Metal-dependent carboxypeptidase n=1 Tax=Aneurinibacillus thermoaerophilus TaxID=143495 RepID=A0ABX8YAW1_ANETH|nr:carboxypeptidase M32 [Aneurinibacillus thermoaerophilus]MED0675097.1 carboxypeptidase M32 [Aneurinibacillus thermoaerophilus]MED0679245.1 carboxypeptidase M32 [Aneurinibacillus thermoaerophilus]MED0737131.1 carboxypeptidase M32 [Aneurinibacillus thermoaerophilus]MED0757177.1 carboxypeptidase M32 [Aneurinibacillus thermoaerophilus]MED0762499.1 carboxypeptidase M32 [Aneurinibacillus thermoaerophilus]
MAQNKAEMTNKFRTYVRKMADYKEAVAVLSWDVMTCAPVRGKEQRAEVIGMLSTELFKLGIAPEMGEMLDNLSDTDTYEALDPVTQAMVRELKKEYDKNKSIPADLFQAYTVLTAKAQVIWEEAKRNNDFVAFQPYLEQIIDHLNQFIDIWGYEGHRYNTLLDRYEPGVTVEMIDPLFADLRKKSVELLERIQANGKPSDTSFLRKHYPAQAQREFSKFVLQKIGYDFTAGRLDESAHPFSTGLNLGDVRITTKIYEHDLQMALYSSIHEVGHAIYEQNIAPELAGTLLWEGASMGIHESQSRFWENIIGRSEAFWSCFYSEAAAMFPGPFAGVSVNAVYRAVNQVQPSLIRIEADELTYNLHIMLRYELEKALITGDLRVADLPGAWAEKMSDYLGITPPNDAQGVLQDVHWSGGDFGYFPTYSLGNIYAAQLEAALSRDIPDYREAVRQGEFGIITRWMKEKVHRHGKMLLPAKIIREATGEGINATYLIAYLEKKYTDVYELA